MIGTSSFVENKALMDKIRAKQKELLEADPEFTNLSDKEKYDIAYEQIKDSLTGMELWQPYLLIS